MRRVEANRLQKENLKPGSNVQANLSQLQERVSKLRSRVLGTTNSSPRRDIIPSRLGLKFHLGSSTVDPPSKSSLITRSSKLLSFAPLPQYGPPPTGQSFGPPPLRLNRDINTYIDYDLELNEKSPLVTARASERSESKVHHSLELENERLRQLLLQNLQHQDHIKTTMDSLRSELHNRSIKISALNKVIKDLQTFKDVTMPALESSLLERETISASQRSRLRQASHPTTCILAEPPPEQVQREVMPQWAAEELAVAVEIRDKLESSVRAILSKTGKAVAAGIVIVNGQQHFLVLNAKSLELFTQPDDAQPIRRMTLAAMTVEISTTDLEISFIDGSGKFVVSCERRADKAEKWIAALKGLQVRFSFRN